MGWVACKLRACLLFCGAAGWTFLATFGLRGFFATCVARGAAHPPVFLTLGSYVPALDFSKQEAGIRRSAWLACPWQVVSVCRPDLRLPLRHSQFAACTDIRSPKKYPGRNLGESSSYRHGLRESQG